MILWYLSYLIILLNVGNMYKTAVMLEIRQKDSRNDLDYNRYKLNKKDIIVEMWLRIVDDKGFIDNLIYL